MKICSECKKEKSLFEFHKWKNSKDGHRAKCKECRSKEYRKNRDKILEERKAHYQRNRNKILLQKTQYRKENPNQNKNWFKNNKEKRRKYERDRLKDPKIKIAKNLRVRLNDALKNNYKSGSAVRDLGCSIEFLKQYFESKFKPGMTWNNYGINGWHIDHIKPLKDFNLVDHSQLLEACHYTNLQPLWATENRVKG